MSTFNFNDFKNILKENNEKTTATGVSFSNKSLKLDSEKDAIEVVEAIQECPRLEYLDLEGNTLGPLAAKAVAEALKKHGSLLKRALWKDMFTSRSKEEIPKALEFLGSALCTAGTTLTELDLSDNAFGPIGLKSLASFLSSNTCYSLQELRLNNNGLGISGGKILAKALLECYENSSHYGSQKLALKVFDVGRNRLENEGAEALALVFKTLTTLEVVAMPQNGICYTGIIALAKGLSANPKLRILNLNDNTVGPKGAEALAKALPSFRHLEHLNLGDCLLQTKGGLILAEALSVEGSHPSLVELNLSYNNIQTKGANPIAKAMADKTYLTSLQLDGNMFGTQGRTILRELLASFEKIHSLGSLSEDETDDENQDEDENEDYEGDSSKGENEDENKDENEDENEKESNEYQKGIEEVHENEKLSSNSQEKKIEFSLTVQEFLKSPTGEQLLLLQYDSIQPFIEHAKTLIIGKEIPLELRFIEEFTKIIMNISSLCGSGYVDVRIKAERLTDSLYAELFSYAIKNNGISMLNNTLLVNLGLIKGEDKRAGKIDWNLEGCFKALEKISQKEYFPSETRDTLKFFLEKPIKNTRAKVIDPFQEAKMALRYVLNGSQTA